METAIIGSALQATENNQGSANQPEQLTIQEKAALYDELIKKWQLEWGAGEFDKEFIDRYFWAQVAYEGLTREEPLAAFIEVLNDYIIAVDEYKALIAPGLLKALPEVGTIAKISTFLAKMVDSSSK